MSASSAMETNNIASDQKTANVEPQFSKRGITGERILIVKYCI